MEYCRLAVVARSGEASGSQKSKRRPPSSRRLTSSQVKPLERALYRQRYGASCDFTRTPHIPASTMTTLHRFAASTLRASARPSLSQRVPVLVRRETVAHNPGMAGTILKDRPTSSPSKAPTSTHGDAEMVSSENAAQATPHNPDYDVAVDYRTS